MTDRTKQVAHYIIARSNPEKLGATKLNKVMWYSDLMSYQNSGRTITGQTSYRKLQLGPVPNKMMRNVQSLLDEGAIAKREIQTPVGIRHEYLWLKEPDIDAFTSREIDILNQVIDLVCNNHSAASISELTHDVLWEETTLNEQIEIGAASVAFDELSESQLSWAAAEIDKLSQVH